MRHLILLILALISPLAPLTALAQTTSQPAWFFAFMRAPIGDSKWEYYLEFQPRFDLNQSAASRLMFRPAAIFNIDADQSVWAGVLQETDLELNGTELRFWEQYQRTDQVSNVILLNRTRFEQRYKGEESTAGLRLRHMLRAQIPVGDEKSWSVVVYDELFVGLNENKNQAFQGFDQNRIFVGARKDFANKTFVEVGYLNRMTPDATQHIPLITVGKVFKRKK